jgi:hypothetical protein
MDLSDCPKRAFDTSMQLPNCSSRSDNQPVCYAKASAWVMVPSADERNRWSTRQ